MPNLATTAISATKNEFFAKDSFVQLKFATLQLHHNVLKVLQTHRYNNSAKSVRCGLVKLGSRQHIKCGLCPAQKTWQITR